MNHPTPADKPDAMTWIITGAAMTFCIIGAPAIVEAALTGIKALVP